MNRFLKHAKKPLLTLGKLLFAACALGYVLHKTNVGEIKTYITNSNPVYLALAFLCINLSAISSAARLRSYFMDETVKMPKSYAIMVYYIGMFFNTMLPGGIGGDGYLTLHFRKKFGFPAMKIIRIMLSTRGNGLFFLNLIFYVVAWFSDYTRIYPQIKIVIISLFLLQLPVYFFAAKYVLKETWATFIRAGVYSIATQVFTVMAAYMAFTAIGMNDGILDYITLFIASTIAAVLPITPGGVGLRELIFYKGAVIAGLNPQLAVAGSLVYFAVYVTTSLTGLVFYILGNKIGLHKEVR